MASARTQKRSIASGLHGRAPYSNLRAGRASPRISSAISAGWGRRRVVRMSLEPGAERGGRCRSVKRGSRRTTAQRVGRRGAGEVPGDEAVGERAAGARDDPGRWRPRSGAPRRRSNARRCGRALRRRRARARTATAPGRRPSPASARGRRPGRRRPRRRRRARRRPPSTSSAPAASASRPACSPPPTEKLGPVSPKAIEHSPATALGEVYGKRRGSAARGAALADARREERVRLDRRQRAPDDDAGALRGARRLPRAAPPTASARRTRPSARASRSSVRPRARAASASCAGSTSTCAAGVDVHGPRRARRARGAVGHDERRVGAAEGARELQGRARRARGGCGRAGARARRDRARPSPADAGRTPRVDRVDAGERLERARGAERVADLRLEAGGRRGALARPASARASARASAGSLNGVAVAWGLTRSTSGRPASSSAAVAARARPAPSRSGAVRCTASEEAPKPVTNARARTAAACEREHGGALAERHSVAPDAGRGAGAARPWSRAAPRSRRRRRR